MPRKKSYESDDSYVFRSTPKRSFDELIRQVPVEQFVRMVNRSNLSRQDAAELCRLFKEKKA